jgi:BTB/POZ domain
VTESSRLSSAAIKSDPHGENNDVVAMYHVHRCVLAFGPRRSDYFLTLLHQQDERAILFAESQDKTSRTQLNVLQSKAFPEFLDYMYSTGQAMTFSTDTATALYSLAKYFAVKRLQNEAKKFCLRDMLDVNQCGTYYEHATILQEDTILIPAAKFCRANIVYIDHNSSRLLCVPDPQFWLDLMKDHAAKGTTLHNLRCLHVWVGLFHCSLLQYTCCCLVPGDGWAAYRRNVFAGEPTLFLFVPCFCVIQIYIYIYIYKTRTRTIRRKRKA